MKELRAIVLLSILLLSCNKQRHHHSVNGFYYWKTHIALSEYEQKRLQELDCHLLYIRLFDVDWNEGSRQAIPQAIASLKKVPAGMTIVPVIYITARTLAHLDSSSTTNLANNICSLGDQLLSNANISFNEFQVDCDWTKTNREQYFSLLRALKAQALLKGKTLSCTIRLHQVKFKENTGIPPVDKGMLMCYNMGDLKRPGSRNSILDVAEAKKYLANLEQYPLKLDAALPIFSWCLLFDQEQFKGILRDVQPEDLQLPLFKEKQKNLFSCTADTVWKGYSLKKGNEIRTEISEPGEIRNMAEYLSGHIRNDSLAVVLYHADSLTLSKYNTDELEAVYHSFR